MWAISPATRIYLAANAIKYNKKGGSVTFRVTIVEETNNVCIEVLDTGIGIKPELMDRLFNPFDRLGAEKTQPEVEGTGLGLVVCKNLVEAMKGSINGKRCTGDLLVNAFHQE